jgi:carbon storage regulator
MLVLSRHRDESIMIGDDITVTIVDIRGDKVRLGVDAPNDVPVLRGEVYEAIRRNSPPGRWLGPAPELEPEPETNPAPDFTSTAEYQQATLDQLRQEIARLQTDRANIIHDHENELSSLQAQNSLLQDEVSDFKEHLRQLELEICGCEHESADEQVDLILETYRTLAYQKNLNESNPVIAFCSKHQVVHTNGCYVCSAEKE